MQTIQLSGVKEYMEAMISMRATMDSFRYSCIEDFVLKHGKAWTPRRLPKGVRRGEAKQCFGNAANLALGDESLYYVEGFAMGVIPTLHAWCARIDGVVIDPTWASAKVPLGKEYFGVPFKTDFLRKILLRRKSYGVIDDLEGRWPLLRGEGADGILVPEAFGNR
jgi:hypothetical protein